MTLGIVAAARWPRRFGSREAQVFGATGGFDGPPAVRTAASGAELCGG